MQNFSYKDSHFNNVYSSKKFCDKSIQFYGILIKDNLVKNSQGSIIFAHTVKCEKQFAKQVCRKLSPFFERIYECTEKKGWRDIYQSVDNDSL